MTINFEAEIAKGVSFLPSTRYQGSKRRLSPWLFNAFKEIEFESVLDGFGGSASVSYLLKLMGKSVDFNDILKSNYQTGIALIENDSILLEEADVDFLVADHGLQYPSFIKDTFKDIYFYPAENKWLDMIVHNINNLSEKYEDKDVLRMKQALAFHALFQACLSKRPFNLFHRKNLYLRKAEVTRSFGNKKTWDLKFAKLFKKFAMEASSKVFSNGKNNKAYCSDLLSFNSKNYDLVYLDPPYQRPSENQPKDYLSLYHFLDGLVDYSNWPSRIDSSKKHKPLQKTTSKFDTMSPLERIETVVGKFSDSKIAISYGDPGKPTIEELKELLYKYKKNVEVHEVEYSYKLNKKNGDALQEVLIIGT